MEPSKREDSTQCCFTIDLPPTALDQHKNNIGSSLHVCWESCPHYDTRVPSGSGWNRLNTVLCVLYSGLHIWFDPEKNATKGFSTVYCSIRCAYLHIKSLPKSDHAKSIIFKMASKMAAKSSKFHLFAH